MIEEKIINYKNGNYVLWNHRLRPMVCKVVGKVINDKGEEEFTVEVLGEEEIFSTRGAYKSNIVKNIPSIRFRGIEIKNAFPNIDNWPPIVDIEKIKQLY